MNGQPQIANPEVGTRYLEQEQSISLQDEAVLLAALMDFVTEDVVPEAGPSISTEVRCFFSDTSTWRYDDFNTAELRALLNEVTSRVDADSDPAPYESIRKEFCEINIELNRRMELAPSFRPTRVPAHSPDAGDEEERDQLSRDRQIIDLDWIARGKIKFRPDDRAFKNLIVDGKLDVPLAEKFAAKSWRAEIKAEILAMPYIIQIQLTTLRSKAARDRVRNVRKSVDRVIRRDLNDACLRGRLDPSNVEALCDLALARKLTEGESSKTAMSLLALIQGEPEISAAKYKSQMKKLNRLMDKTRTRSQTL